MNRWKLAAGVASTWTNRDAHSPLVASVCTAGHASALPAFHAFFLHLPHTHVHDSSTPLVRFCPHLLDAEAAARRAEQRLSESPNQPFLTRRNSRTAPKRTSQTCATWGNENIKSNDMHKSYFISACLRVSRRN